MAAAATNQEASSSISRYTYHVFLSFRGEDTRKNFTSHLYEALKLAGIHTFLDDDGIERGEDIGAELQKAIKESKISIIVFSRDYASSRWCLDELVIIMEQREVGGLTVLPVFYDVDPSQVRKQTGSYAKAFTKHKKLFKKEMHRVEGWRTALKKVADLAGMALNNRHEAQFIQDIVREIQEKLKKLKRPGLIVAPHLVGIDSRVKDINGWLQVESSVVDIATIFGIGGIGKTTIAKTVYNLNIDKFQGGSFLENVKDTLKEANGLVGLLNQLLSNLLNRKINDVKSVNDGIIMIKDAICYREVLLVFDDVDQLDLLDIIIGMQEWLYPGSKIIITTRHARLLKAHEVCVNFEVKKLDDNESLQLLSWHAFGQGHPTEGYMECSRKVVDMCGGLPLALKVLGRSLSGESIDVWESALQELEATIDDTISKVLKISYDSLKNDDKDLFLDIACFFIGMDKDYTVVILDGCQFYTKVGISRLIDRCLLSVNEGNKLMMHQLIKAMGREIVRGESRDHPGKRSRLWRHKDVVKLLKEKTGTETVKGLTLDLRTEDKHGKTIISENHAKQHHDEVYLTKSTIGNCSQPRCLSNEVDLETETFMNMHELKLLQLNYVKLRGDFKYFSKNLVWLCWYGFPLESIPTNFNLEKLVALDMPYSSLKHVWTGTKFFPELKSLNVSHSHGLDRTPDFSGLPSLEILKLEDCINLVEVDESIGNLYRLVFLNLNGCKNLRKLPKEIETLESLEVFTLSGCSKLFGLPEELGKLSLLPMTSWYSTLRSWFSPTRTPHSMSFSLAFLPHCVSYLNLENCKLSDSAISHGFASLPSLRVLDLSGNPFRSLPKSMKGLTKLETLFLIHCKELQWIPEFSNGVKDLIEFVTKLVLADGLWIAHCVKLVEIEGLFKLEPLENADVTVLKSLGLSNLESLRSIEVDLNGYTSERRRTPLQVLHECEVLSIFLPESEIPSCFNLQRMGSSISFDVPPRVGHKICGLNLCTVYGSPSSWDPIWDCAVISNKTKRVRWTYSPIFFGIPKKEDIVKDMLWLSHWKIGDQLEVGDRIVVSVHSMNHKVKMCGICLVYELEDKGIQSNTEEIVPSAFPWFRTHTHTTAGVDTYFRCHHSYRVGRGIKRDPQFQSDPCFLCKQLERDLTGKFNTDTCPDDFIDYYAWPKSMSM